MIEVVGESFGVYGREYCVAEVGVFESGFGSGSEYYGRVYGNVSEYGAGHNDSGSGNVDLFVCTIEIGADHESLVLTDLTEDSYYLYVTFTTETSV